MQALSVASRECLAHSEYWKAWLKTLKGKMLHLKPCARQV